jgi:hypothetical protein
MPFRGALAFPVSSTLGAVKRMDDSNTRQTRNSDPAPAAGTVPQARSRWLSLSWWERSRFGDVFGADLRSLAALRIVLAAIVVMDMIARWPDLRVHYTDEGVMPRSLLVDGFVRWRWSLNLVNDTYAFQAFLLLATIVAAICMMLGYRARLATVIVFVMVVSIQVRNPFVLSGADSLLRVLMFWAMFLPLGAAWSLDARKRPGSLSLSNRFLSFATIGIFLQIAFMYWFTAALKSSPEWRSDGTALYYALGAGHITRPFGEYLHQFPELLRVMTHASLGLEIVAPILLFCPFFTGPVRTFAIASIMSFHLGIYLTMDVGIFPWTSALCMVCFLPSWFWDTLIPRIQARIPRRVAMTGDNWRSALQPIHDRWIPIRDRVGHVAMSLSTASGTADGFTVSPPPAVNRVDRPAVSIQDDVKHTTTLRSSPLVNLFLAGCLVFVFLWNWTAVSSFRMPSETLPFAYSTGLYQKWNMFAPRPSTATVWIVVRGVLEDGREIDLLTPIVHDDLTRVPVLSWDQPDDIVGEYYGSKYWRKYLTAIGQEKNDEERQAFAAYACRTWNGHYGGDVRLVGLQVIRMSQRTLPDYEDAPTRRSIIAQYRCG